ncbi:hypothetical protein BDR07DRAFT_1429077 [Suillus spraguei]|nr:hypothetical protein BDR07DRAFT_1429077 [Suillus spraguei]
MDIAGGVTAVMALERSAGYEQILSGMHTCSYVHQGDFQILFSMVWMLGIVWEVLALCLSVWISVKHFRNLRRPGLLAGSIRDCFRVLIKSHVLYFASFVCVSCLRGLGTLSPELTNSYSIGVQAVNGALQILTGVQMFVLGPRLILSVRENHAELLANSDAETSMDTIVFQERAHVSTSSIM